MSASTWFWRLLGTITAGLCLATPSGADDKDKKETGKGKDAKAVIVIQLDASKVPPDLLKKLIELSRNTAGDKKDDDEKGEKGKKAKKDEDDDEKGKKTKKGEDDDEKGKKTKKAKKDEDDDEKGEKGRSDIVQVDLNKLPHELAKRLKEELAKSKGGRK
jgi:hypothetical protein